jgi:hypothetical protein
MELVFPWYLPLSRGEEAQGARVSLTLRHGQLVSERAALAWNGRVILRTAPQRRAGRLGGHALLPLWIAFRRSRIGVRRAFES